MRASAQTSLLPNRSLRFRLWQVAMLSAPSQVQWEYSPVTISQRSWNTLFNVPNTSESNNTPSIDYIVDMVLPVSSTCILVTQVRGSAHSLMLASPLINTASEDGDASLPTKHRWKPVSAWDWLGWNSGKYSLILNSGSRTLIFTALYVLILLLLQFKSCSLWSSQGSVSSSTTFCVENKIALLKGCLGRLCGWHRFWRQEPGNLCATVKVTS